MHANREEAQGRDEEKGHKCAKLSDTLNAFLARTYSLPFATAMLLVDFSSSFLMAVSSIDILLRSNVIVSIFIPCMIVGGPIYKLYLW